MGDGKPGQRRYAGAVPPLIYTRMLASVADRDRTIRMLQDSFAEGRLTRDELDQRLGQALRTRDFPQLLALIADLPRRGPFDRLPAHRSTPRRTSSGWIGWPA